MLPPPREATPHVVDVAITGAAPSPAAPSRMRSISPSRARPRREKWQPSCPAPSPPGSSAPSSQPSPRPGAGQEECGRRCSVDGGPPSSSSWPSACTRSQGSSMSHSEAKRQGRAAAAGNGGATMKILVRDCYGVYLKRISFYSWSQGDSTVASSLAMTPAPAWVIVPLSVVGGAGRGSCNRKQSSAAHYRHPRPTRRSASTISCGRRAARRRRRWSRRGQPPQNPAGMMPS